MGIGGGGEFSGNKGGRSSSSTPVARPRDAVNLRRHKGSFSPPFNLFSLETQMIVTVPNSDLVHCEEAMKMVIYGDSNSQDGNRNTS